MSDYEGRLAVVTGGGTGMGRELVRQLAARGCSVATCDVFADTLAETRDLALADSADGVTVSTHVADVADEAQLEDFRDEMAAIHERDCVHFVFNNAGIGGGGSMIAGDRDEWDRVFSVCWGGVYFGTRVFLPLLMAADRGHLVNTSSVNGFWASLGPSVPHTAYSAAKFAVKGFSEALVNDLRLHAPHVSVSVVMPGHIGTSIVLNSARALGQEPKDLTAEQLDQVRENVGRRGFDISAASDEDIRVLLQQRGEMFRDEAPLSAAEAATTILGGVEQGRWRILVGADAEALDHLVRADPESAYEPEFMERLLETGEWNTIGR